MIQALALSEREPMYILAVLVPIPLSPVDENERTKKKESTEILSFGSTVLALSLRCSIRPRNSGGAMAFSCDCKVASLHATIKLRLCSSCFKSVSATAAVTVAIALLQRS